MARFLARVSVLLVLAVTCREAQAHARGLTRSEVAGLNGVTLKLAFLQPPAVRVGERSHWRSRWEKLHAPHTFAPQRQLSVPRSRRLGGAAAIFLMRGEDLKSAEEAVHINTMGKSQKQAEENAQSLPVGSSTDENRLVPMSGAPVHT